MAGGLFFPPWAVIRRAGDRSQAGRRSRSPAEIAAAYLHGVPGRSALILSRVSIVAAQAVNLQLAGDVLPHDLYRIIGLSRAAARSSVSPAPPPGVCRPKILVNSGSVRPNCPGLNVPGQER